jgi:ribosomal protein S18 acetylase RimI-like enzyme
MSAGPRGLGRAADGVCTVRRGHASDAEACASLHSKEIATGFLSALGPAFLRRLYRRVAACEGSFLLIAQDEGGTAGFLAGSVAVGRLYRTFLIRDSVAAAARAPLALAKSWRSVMETLRHGRGGESSGAELLAVAVDPVRRGRGTGRMLVERFLEESRALGATSATVVLGSENQPAMNLYRRAGFSSQRTFEMHRGTTSVLMRRDEPPGTV